MVRSALLALAIVLVLAPAAGARARCAPRSHEHLAARSSQAVLFTREYGGPDDQTTGTILTGCSQRTGVRRRLVKTEGTTSGGDVLDAVRLTGTRVAFVLTSNTKEYVGPLAIVVSDVVRRVRPVTLPQPPFSFREDSARVEELAIAAGGQVAWTDRGRLSLWRPGGDVRLVDRGFALAAVGFHDGTLTWSHAGSPRSLWLGRTPDRCASQSLTGTPEVDVFASDQLTSACLRQTGATVRFSRGVGGIDVSGAFAVAWGRDVIERANVETGTLERFDAHGVVLAVVDAAGSFAWIEYPPGSSAAVWAQDGAGRRLEASSFSGLTLTRDGTTVHYGAPRRYGPPDPTDQGEFTLDP